MNYRRNEDRLCRGDYQRGYNAIIDVSRTGGADYITLAEVKAHMRVDFADEDVYITMLIKAAREAIEKYTGLSLVPTEVVAELRNEKGGIELPYGPYITETLVSLDGEDEPLDVELRGLEFPVILTAASYIHATYSAGYTSDTLPSDLRLAVYHQVAYLYENRGDGRLSETAKQLANPYKRIGWLI